MTGSGSSEQYSFLISSQKDEPAVPADAGLRVGVLLAKPFADVYDYVVCDNLLPPIGTIVQVPFGRQQTYGVIWGAGTGTHPIHKVKAVSAVLDLPPLSAVMMQFVDWVARYTVAPRGAVLKMVLSCPQALAPVKTRRVFSAAGVPEQHKITWTPARKAVWQALQAHPQQTATELAAAADCTPAVIRKMAAHGVILSESVPDVPSFDMPNPAYTEPNLSPLQAEIGARLRARVQKRVVCATEQDAAPADVTPADKSVTLLQGVTGAGKTEVYFEAIAEAMAHARQVLVLLPEIALTEQWLMRFAARFGTRPLHWHSDTTASSRRDTWRAVLDGMPCVVVGARSALFLPFQKLGLIVVDEEHEAAYKQEDGVVYHARDMAVVRGHLDAIPVVLASATPSLESLVNAQSGKYNHDILDQRFGAALMPEIILVDLCKTPPEPIGGAVGAGDASPVAVKPEHKGWLAPDTVQALTETLAAGDQSLLFLNRRGYAPLTLCKSCGSRQTCSQCTAWLVHHKASGRLVCHHCGYATPMPTVCDSCGAEHSFVACGPGVERIAEEVHARFPQARIELATSDSLHNPQDYEAMLHRILTKQADIIVGTQLMAKGHNFPDLTCVGIVDGDLGLFGGDLRATERTFQLLQQVAGRAGRHKKRGRVFIQSHEVGHPVMQAMQKQDQGQFMELEVENRKELGYPPFGRLAAVIVSGEHEAEVEQYCMALQRSVPKSESIRVLGPAIAPMAVLRGRHRRRFLIKSSLNQKLQAFLYHWVHLVKKNNNIRVQIDVDPYSFV